MTIPIYPPIFLFSIPPLSYGKHFHPRKWSFSRQVTSTKLSRALSWILEVKFPSIGNVHRWEPPSRKRWEFISRARSVFQAIHRHGSRSIENSVARAEMDANKSIGFPNEIKQARETFHPIDERPSSSLFLFSTPLRRQREDWKMKNRRQRRLHRRDTHFFPL